MDEFTHIERNGKHVLLREDALDTLLEPLLSEGEQTVEALGGRGVVARIPWQGEKAAIVRPYLRGGLIGHFLKDAFILANRPMREFEVHQYALSQGLEVPPLLGICWWRRGVLVRGAIATEALEAKHLQAWLESCTPGAEEMAKRCGALIARMHNAGIWHADLQLRNILISETGPYLIDFDGARVMSRVAPIQRTRNLLRLRRSFEKNSIDLNYYNMVLAGYGSPRPPRWLEKLYTFKGRASSTIFGKK